jgi:hypothetical protein
MAVSRASDFLIYWQAGRDLVAGGWAAVYDVKSLTPFKYHPFFALFFAPWGFLPAALAKSLWAILNGLAVLDTARRWRRCWGIDAAAIGIGFVGVVHALTWQLKFANVTFFMLWLWTVALTSPSLTRQAVGYGLLIALKPFWLALLLPWVLARRVRLVEGVAVVLVGISLVPALLGIDALQSAYDGWLGTFADPLHEHNYPKTDNQGWYGLLFRHADALGGAVPLLWLGGALVVAGLWLWAWRRFWWRPTNARIHSAMELSIVPFILWTAPLSWIHHQILLWPLLAWLGQFARRHRPSRWIWGSAWALLNGTGGLLLGAAASRTVHRWGVPILAFPLLTWWCAQHLASTLSQPDDVQA